MRHLKLVVASLVVLLGSSAPALAQSPSAGADQYTNHSPGPCGPDVFCSPSLADGVHDTTDTAAEGTKAVNEALSGTASSDSKVAGLTELPETGGPSLLLPGVMLAASGLLVRRAVR